MSPRRRPKKLFVATTRRRLIILPAVFMLLLGCGSTSPAWIDRFEVNRPAPKSPTTAPEEWVLSFVDIETTGLIPGWHEPIDVGIVVTDIDGNEIDHYFRRIMPRHPERISPGARAVNAFDAGVWRDLGAISPEDAVREIIEFHRRVAGDRTVMMVAFNSQFDTAFLDHLFRSAERSWREVYHYFVLDIPSMAWARGYRQLTGSELSKALEIPDEPRVAAEHTGITGAKLNVRIYRALLHRAGEIPNRAGTTQSE